MDSMQIIKILTRINLLLLVLFQFFCSMSATFTLNFFLSGLQSSSWGYFYMPGLINFDVFKVSKNAIKKHAYAYTVMFAP